MTLDDIQGLGLAALRGRGMDKALQNTLAALMFGGMMGNMEGLGGMMKQGMGASMGGQMNPMLMQALLGRMNQKTTRTY